MPLYVIRMILLFFVSLSTFISRRVAASLELIQMPKRD